MWEVLPTLACVQVWSVSRVPLTSQPNISDWIPHHSSAWVLAARPEGTGSAATVPSTVHSYAWPEFEPKWGNPCASPHCFTVFLLTSSLSSFMASHVLLKASEEEMKGRLLSRLCTHMSPDELFSPGRAHKGLQLMLHGTLKKEQRERKRIAEILLEISMSIPLCPTLLQLHYPILWQT